MLLNRIHPTAVVELRATRQGNLLEREMTTLLHLLSRQDDVVALSGRCNVDPRRVGWASWELSFENMYPFRSPIELQEAQPSSEDILDQIYVVRADSSAPCLLTEHDGSLVSAMRDRSIVGACVYYFSEERRPDKVAALHTELKRHLG